MAALLSRPVLPSAVFAQSDEMAMGALRAIRKAGLRCPEDISMVGFDDHEMAELFELTTVAQPVSELGAMAARHLVAALRGVVVPDSTTVATRLVIRGTTCPPRSPDGTKGQVTTPAARRQPAPDSGGPGPGASGHPNMRTSRSHAHDNARRSGMTPDAASRREGRRPGRRPRGARRPAALAVSLVLLGLGLTACSSGSGGSNTLTWYLNPDNGSGAKIADGCTKASNGAYKISISALPTSADDQRTELIRRLAAKDSSIDLMSLDPPFVAEAANAGYLTTFGPVSGSLAQQLTQGDLQAPITSATYDGQLVAIPHWSNTQLLWYRKSVAQAAGVDPTSPNFTWDQMIKAAVGQHKLVSEQGFKYEGYSVWINALVLSAGGNVVTDTTAGRNAKITIDSPAGRLAAGVIDELVHSSAASPSLSTDMEEQGRAEFEGSSGGFLLNWPYVWSAAQTDVKDGTKPSSLLSDIGWARYPQVTAGHASAPPYGGIDLGISHYSKHQSLDLQAVECLTSAANQAPYMILSGNPAAKGSVYDDPAVQKAFPMASVIRDSINAAGPRARRRSTPTSRDRSWRRGARRPVSIPARRPPARGA